MNRQRIKEAIKDLGFKVRVADVVQRTGMPVLAATAELNRIAYESEGHLEVDSSGGVLYKFDPHFESRNLMRGSKSIAAGIARNVYNALTWAIRIFTLALFTLIRISFGLLLILSVVVVIVAVVVLFVALIARFFSFLGDSGGDSGGGDGGGWSFDLGGCFNHFHFCSFDWMFDWWYWNHNYTSWDWDSKISAAKTPDIAAASDSESSEGEESEQPKEGFIDACFMVLFGNGDPNVGLEERRWQTVAQAIRAKSGVVLAEDLAPYVVTDKRSEDWMIPILVRFNGSPEVTESGKLVYTFPSFIPRQQAQLSITQQAKRNELDEIYNRFLQRQTIKTTAQHRSQSLPKFLKEQTIALTGVSTDGLIAVFGFALIALGGSLFLLLGNPDFYVVQLLKPVLLAIAGYSALFFIMPLLRMPFVIHANAAIEKRNDSYVLAAQKLATPTSELHIAQGEANAVRQAFIRESTSTTVYSTEEDLLEQAFTH